MSSSKNNGSSRTRHEKTNMVLCIKGILVLPCLSYLNRNVSKTPHMCCVTKAVLIKNSHTRTWHVDSDAVTRLFHSVSLCDLMWWYMLCVWRKEEGNQIIVPQLFSFLFWTWIGYYLLLILGYSYLFKYWFGFLSAVGYSVLKGVNQTTDFDQYGTHC